MPPLSSPTCHHESRVRFLRVLRVFGKGGLKQFLEGLGGRGGLSGFWKVWGGGGVEWFLEGLGGRGGLSGFWEV